MLWSQKIPFCILVGIKTAVHQNFTPYYTLPEFDRSSEVNFVGIIIETVANNSYTLNENLNKVTEGIPREIEK